MVEDAHHQNHHCDRIPRSSRCREQIWKIHRGLLFHLCFEAEGPTIGALLLWEDYSKHFLWLFTQSSGTIGISIANNCISSEIHLDLVTTRAA